MAVNFRDPTSGFRHSEVVTFINQEILSEGGGLDFYEAYRTQSWHQVEDQLSALVADPQVPRAFKRACTWSALALSVRFLRQNHERQLIKVRRLQEQVAQQETTTWKLASQLKHLREAHQQMAVQLRQARENLKQSMGEHKWLCRQLLEADRSAYSESVSSEALPQNAKEQVVLETEGAAAAAVVPRQTRCGRIYPPGLRAAGGSQEEMLPPWDQRIHIMQEKSVMATFLNPSQQSWSQGDPRNQQPQD